MKKKCFDDMEFKDNKEMIDYLSEKTANFNVIDFYNEPGDASGMIIITPEQVIEVDPIFYHQFAACFIYELLYGMDYDQAALEKTNNIIIRLVRGSSYQFYSIFPKKITPYQADKFMDLVDELKDYENLINFPDVGGYSKLLFGETYQDSVNKINNVNIVGEIPNIVKDNYIIGANKKAL